MDRIEMKAPFGAVVHVVPAGVERLEGMGYVRVASEPEKTKPAKKTVESDKAE